MPNIHFLRIVSTRDRKIHPNTNLIRGLSITSVRCLDGHVSGGPSATLTSDVILNRTESTPHEIILFESTPDGWVVVSETTT